MWFSQPALPLTRYALSGCKTTPRRSSRLTYIHDDIRRRVAENGNWKNTTFQVAPLGLSGAANARRCT
jgi:hypothetical protein